MDYKLERFQKYQDDRGDLVVFLRTSNLENKYRKFGQIYFVTFEKKGAVRGNHYHKHWREWFGVVYGKLELLLKDMKTGEEKRMILNGNNKRYIRLEIGPNIAHAFKSLTKKAALLNYANSEWTNKDDFHHKLM